MMKIGSLISLLIFLNFTALPTIAGFFSWDLPSSNLIISEEETSHAPLVINEKSLPKIINVHDFINFLAFESERKISFVIDDSNHLPIYFKVPSPPPDFLI
ncbi:hypothetical protein [Frigoriflavimonas asaccharolytica]|uniref:Uncharacterized protein n=1 Tax=Frigoriflavimonas asaccharolytica TaxID=2735899 RepID=A0A8J8GA31_9FLAO|nr:hypothetical protein [Frigoriflavimonas asaccharolytica]NRS93696.1 hypothetical protein [Frigoriflavimonas asaccharolytica]